MKARKFIAVNRVLVDAGPDHYARLEAVKMFTRLMHHGLSQREDKRCLRKADGALPARTPQTLHVSQVPQEHRDYGECDYSENDSDGRRKIGPIW